MSLENGWCTVGDLYCFGYLKDGALGLGEVSMSILIETVCAISVIISSHVKLELWVSLMYFEMCVSHESRMNVLGKIAEFWDGRVWRGGRIWNII